MKHKLFFVTAIVALLLAVGITWTYAQSEVVTYSACVNNSSGTIHMVAPDEPCSNNEERIVWNNQGPPGTKGDQGEKGAPGAPGVLGFYTKEDYVSIAASSYGSVIVTCDQGDVATGGGYEILNNVLGDPLVTITNNHYYGESPLNPAPSSWYVRAYAVAPTTLFVYVVCADMNTDQP